MGLASTLKKANQNNSKKHYLSTPLYYVYLYDILAFVAGCNISAKSKY